MTTTWGKITFKFFLQLKSENGYKLSDICWKPLAPDNDNCLIMGYLDWWQNDWRKIEKNWNPITSKSINEEDDNYLDHFLMCSTTTFSTPCLGRYGGPIDPSIVLGGYNKIGNFLLFITYVN